MKQLNATIHLAHLFIYIRFDKLMVVPTDANYFSKQNMSYPIFEFIAFLHIYNFFRKDIKSGRVRN